jgi:hypothetical protein
VGQKIDLEYNIETMRITDAGGEDGDSGSFGHKPSASLMESIKAKSQVQAADAIEGNTPTKWERATGTPAWEQGPKVSADIQSSKLKQMLGKIKAG